MNQNNGKLILVCDDDPLLVELLEFRLTEKGFDVAIARDGVESLQKAGELRPAAIILDAMMPHMDGFEVLSRLKGNAILAKTPVIMLTARNSENDIVSALEKGAEDYVVKPFIPEELVARLTRLLLRQDLV